MIIGNFDIKCWVDKKCLPVLLYTNLYIFNIEIRYKEKTLFKTEKKYTRVVKENW